MELKRAIEKFWKRADSRLRKPWEELPVKYILLASVVAGLLLFFTRSMFIILLGLMTTLISVLVSRYELNAMGIETVTFSTVVIGAALGPEKGALAGLALILLQMFTGNPPGVYVLWVTPAYSLAGYLAGSIEGYGIQVLGPVMAAGLQTVFFLFSLIFTREKAPRYIQYAAFNIAINYALFTAFGPPALELLG